MHTFDIVFQGGQWIVQECYPSCDPFTAYYAGSLDDAVRFVADRTHMPVVVASVRID